MMEKKEIVLTVEDFGNDSFNILDEFGNFVCAVWIPRHLIKQKQPDKPLDDNNE